MEGERRPGKKLLSRSKRPSVAVANSSAEQQNPHARLAIFAAAVKSCTMTDHPVFAFPPSRFLRETTGSHTTTPLPEPLPNTPRPLPPPNYALLTTKPLLPLNMCEEPSMSSNMGVASSTKLPAITNNITVGGASHVTDYDDLCKGLDLSIFDDDANDDIDVVSYDTDVVSSDVDVVSCDTDVVSLSCDIKKDHLPTNCNKSLPQQENGPMVAKDKGLMVAKDKGLLMVAKDKKSLCNGRDHKSEQGRGVATLSGKRNNDASVCDLKLPRISCPVCAFNLPLGSTYEDLDTHLQSCIFDDDDDDIL